MFLGNPCPCGWAFDEVSETEMFCERCGRIKTLSSNHWTYGEPSVVVDRLQTASEKREYTNKGTKLKWGVHQSDLLNDRKAAVRAQHGQREAENKD